MFTSKHNPYGEGSKHLDNVRLESLIGEYQAKGDAGSLGEIVRLTQTRALTLIRFHKTARYAAEDELLSALPITSISSRRIRHRFRTTSRYRARCVR